MLEQLLKENFSGMIVRKSPTQELFQTLSVPAFIKDWFIRRYADGNGEINTNFLQEKLDQILPSKVKWTTLLDKMFHGEHVKFLAKLRIKASIKSGNISFELPDYGVGYDDTFIPSFVWEKSGKALMATGGDIWGIVDLSYNKDKKIELDEFQDFKPYSVDLNYYKKARKNFTLDEWIDVLLGAMGYNVAGYDTETQKLAMIKRLLPFVEKRINLIELAPKGTGKSYVFSQISKKGWLSSGGIMTRAKMFYDMNSKQEGLIANYDYVALDEISTIKFGDAAEMQGALKGYLESGKYTVGIKSGSGNAGLILLGNIPSEQMNENLSMFDKLPPIFKDTALIDRFHGFIKGWEIPRMKENLKADGWALNSEYFAEILHAMRDDVTAGGIVSKLLDVPNDADTRDTTAVKRIATGLLKLLFPHWQSENDADKEMFNKYCLAPAVEMRKIIRTQLGILDVEYKDKAMPEFKVK